MINLRRQMSNEEFADLLMARLILEACPVPRLTNDEWLRLIGLFDTCDDPAAHSVLEWALQYRFLSLAVERLA